MPIKTYFRIFLLLGIIFQFSCTRNEFISTRETIDLSGTWQFAMDSAQVGIEKNWFSELLTETVQLPGTMDENDKGIPNKNYDETMRLSREKMYEGWAWYQKEITINESWKSKEIFLTLERTKPAKIWIDGQFTGENATILSPQKYNLTPALTPGKHVLTILVNNGNGSVPNGIKGSHSWTEHTQTNWNGIIGEIKLEATEKNYISLLAVTPELKTKEAVVALRIFSNEAESQKVKVKLRAASWNTQENHNVPAKSYEVNLSPGQNRIVLKYPAGDKMQLWSEFSPALYKLSAELITENGTDNLQANFGFRNFSTSGTQFTINGTTTFLRGEHNACVFPLTAHPPMDVESWIELFQIAKSYGINHYRYHSWTPPDAAFAAADIEGIYMQPETPFWGSLRENDPSGLNEFLLNEGEKIIESYGNHASFVMFALGNELSGSLDQMQKMVNQLRPLAPEKLFAYGSNNYLGTRGQVEGEDFLVTCRVGADTDTSYSTHTRASFSFADAYDGGYINGRYPSTDLNYAGAISKCSVPVIGHEIAQYQVYPNFDEIKKYTGVLKPWNLEIFKKRLEAAGMADQAKDFFRASGALSALGYRADIEMAIRTPGFGGFQLLDLQDFSGQGTALVGLLDAFMDSKGLITPEEFSHFSNKVVPLLITEKYCWTNGENFSAKIQVANYSESDLENQKLTWQIINADGEIVGSGSDNKSVPQGEVFNFTEVKQPLSELKAPQKLTLQIVLEETSYQNTYPIWVYPENKNISVPSEIYISENIDAQTISQLNSGEKVLLFPNHKKYAAFSVGGLFTTDYWNYKMFKGISENNNKPVSPGTMGILTNPEHPLFTSFPTEFHSNWQWWPIVKKSRPFILDNAPDGYKPLVQVIDNIERNHKLGLVFEFAVGEGKLLICMSDLKAIQDKPEARQFYKSILEYMDSDDFQPETKLTEQELKTLFTSVPAEHNIQTIGNISYE
ncbi:sugar-binding domain-containing protein [Maribellus comscasis]|uniref:sugar-binding domain-containing protein n=1 Tax=Maribellus comscasis TaxID=2681766 RepID=UPI001C2D827F|nr:sugar-binding domain-containing protein [Maribellus comscasis]